MERLTAGKLAEMLDGRQIGNEITADEEKLAKDNGLVVVYGASDDLMEIAGAIDDEMDCYGGGKVYIKGCNAYYGNLAGQIDECFSIEAVWCPTNMNCSWVYFTNIPHADFKIYEYDELYCIGIVFDIHAVCGADSNVAEVEQLKAELDKCKDLLKKALQGFEYINTNFGCAGCNSDWESCPFNSGEIGACAAHWNHADEVEEVLK